MAEFTFCPVCGNHKPTSGEVCWDCFKGRTEGCPARKDFAGSLFAYVELCRESREKLKPVARERLCKIEGAGIEDYHGAGDGEYGLLSMVGTPEEIGKAIAESLAQSDIYSGGQMRFADRGQDLYLCLRIKISTPEHVNDEEE